MRTPEIPISEIYIGERYRKDYGEIDQLCHSIKKNGLINPVAVGLTTALADELQEGSDCKFTLLAGGRRLRALTKLGWTKIPVRIYSQKISLLDLRSIELAENFDRKDMSYAEEVALMREINNLQISIHGEKIARSPNAAGWSQADTATLLHKSPATIAKDLQLANIIQSHPELGLDQCKNKSEAMKKLKKISKSISNTVKVKAFTATNKGSKDKIFTKLNSSYIIGDCFDTFAKIPSNSLDFIEIDPPYSIDLKKIKRDNDCEGYNEISTDNYLDFLRKLFKESFRTMRADSWIICWFGPDPWFNIIGEELREAGFNLIYIPGLWTKPTGQTLQPETYLASSYEMFFYARKGSPKIQTPGRSNIFNFSPVPPTSKIHPTQRPLELMQEIYSTFIPPNSSGFIPCLGSGVGLLAGHSCSINMIGTDLSGLYKDGYFLMLKDYLGM